MLRVRRPSLFHLPRRRMGNNMSKLSVGHFQGDKDSVFFNLDVRITMGELRVGEIFEYCQPVEDFCKANGLHIERIHLKVLRINAYQRDFQSLDCGITCRVWFEGQESAKRMVNAVMWTKDLHPPKPEKGVYRE